MSGESRGVSGESGGVTGESGGLTGERGGRAGQLQRSGLRPGWTTGACAAAAARAAYQALLTGDFPDPVPVSLPGGRRPSFALTWHRMGGGLARDTPGWAAAAVTKDAGDDPDVTHGAVVWARVEPGGSPGGGIRYVAGAGVGTVTLAGLPVPVGEPAINPVPRRIIAENLAQVGGLPEGGPVQPARPDVTVVVGIEGGEQLARHTLNPRLGIVGGLSVLGTTGVVVPYSCSAWIDSIRSGVDVAAAAGVSHVAATTGSTSEAAVRALYGLPDLALVDMGDFAGAVLKHLRSHPVPRVTIGGGFAKISKLAAGHLDLHSGRSSVDTGFLAALAERAGAPRASCEQIRSVPTADAARRSAEAAGVRLGDLVAERACEQARAVLRHAPVALDVVCVGRDGAVVGRSALSPGPAAP